MLLLIVATHRVTRLVVRDEFPLIKIPRDALANWLDPRDEHGHMAEPSPMGKLGRSIAYLVECDWCMSVWVGGALVLATDYAVGVPWPWLVWAACSTGTGLIAATEQRIEHRSKLDRARASETEADLRRRGRDI